MRTLVIFIIFLIFLLANLPAVAQEKETAGTENEEMLNAIEVKESSLREGGTQKLHDDIDKYLKDEFNCKEISKNLWVVPFVGEGKDEIDVSVLLNSNWVVVSTYIASVQDKKGKDGFKNILELNYEMEQSKIGLDKIGDLYLLYEIPTRLLDKRELIDDINASAKYVSDNYDRITKYLDIKK